MQSVRKTRWQQATALVSLSTCGAMTGIAFAHSSVAELTSPTSVPVKLLALNKPAKSPGASDSALRSAIVQAAQRYLSLAQSRSPSAMEALIWQNDSSDGVDHGESCAAFASLTLESGAQATGQQSWVTGGTTYPWPVHTWVDSRVDPNPESLGVVSILQDAQAHHRWHPLGDGYTPKPGDWVLFDGHVEVVTRYAGGVLDTIGGDSMPNLSVNAHQYDAPLAAQGVTGFVNNGILLSAVSSTADGASTTAVTQRSAGQDAPAPAPGQADQGQADIPGMAGPALALGGAVQLGGQAAGNTGSVSAGSSGASMTATATIPGALAITGNVTSFSSVSSSPRYSRSQVVHQAPSVPDTTTQQAFINEVAPGALAAQRQYGVPAAVTIAQAIDESGWGQSQLATQDNNLFGIKGTGPAGSVMRVTEEFQNGQAVTVTAPFRVYSNVAQSITDHSLLLATGSSYKQAMADRRSPDAFANDLTGVYATDPTYGASLITIMRQYNLYRFDAGSAGASDASTGSSGQTSPAQSGAGQSSPAQSGAGQSGSVLSGSGLGALQGGSQSGTAGQSAVIPGAIALNAAGLGMAAQPSPAQGAAGHGVSGAGGTAPSRVAHSSSAPHGRPVRNGTSVQGRVSTRHGASVRPGGATGRAGTGSAATGRAGTGGAGMGRPGSGDGAPVQRSASTSGAGAQQSGEASIPGLDAYAGQAATPAATGAHVDPRGGQALRAGPRNVRISTRRYVTQMPRTVLTDFVTTAKIPLLRAKPVYQGVAASNGIHWELLAACDWMQCQAQPGVSPVFGEKLGTKNPDGSVYRTKDDALDQCATDLIELAAAVYGINLRQRRLLSVRDLANVFAAFRWGGLLKAHRISAMEFPYSVEGLSPQHLKMRWPDVGEDAPDKPGTRFRMSFGAVPVVLRLNYPALA